MAFDNHARHLLFTNLTRRQFIARLTALGLSMPAAGAVSAMTSPHYVYAQANSGGTLRYGTWQPIDNLDPQIGGLQVSASINQGMHDCLVRRKPGDPKTYPNLATSWEASPDSKTYTFKLRDDVKFHDGTPFNAAAVKASFDRIVDPDTKSGGALTAIGPYDSSEVIDDYTVKVNFKQPNGAFLTMLSTVWLAPQSPTATAQWGQDYQDHISGTGPFMLKEYVHNDHVTLVRNPDYNWAPEIYQHTGPALLDEIIFTIVTEDATRVAALKSGDLDLIDRMPPRDLADLSSSDDYKTLTGAAGGVVWTLALHVQKAPTEDPAVRKAIMMTYDSSAIVDLLFQGTLEPAYNLLEPTMTGYSEDTKSLINHDPEGAKQVLEDAGWTMGSNGTREKDGQPLKIVLIIFASWGIDEMAVTLQAQLKEVGIDMEIRSLEQAAAHAAIDAGEHNAAFTFSWWADPSILYNFFGTELIGHGNKPNYSNPEVDQWLRDGLATTDDAERAAIYNKVVTAVMSDAAAIPFFQKRINLASKSNLDLEAVNFNIEGYPNFYEVGYLS